MEPTNITPPCAGTHPCAPNLPPVRVWLAVDGNRVVGVGALAEAALEHAAALAGHPVTATTREVEIRRSLDVDLHQVVTDLVGSPEAGRDTPYRRLWRLVTGDIEPVPATQEQVAAWPGRPPVGGRRLYAAVGYDLAGLSPDPDAAWTEAIAHARHCWRLYVEGDRKVGLDPRMGDEDWYVCHQLANARMWGILVGDPIEDGDVHEITRGVVDAVRAGGLAGHAPAPSVSASTTARSEARPAVPPTDEDLARWADSIPVADYSGHGVTIYTCHVPGNAWTAGPTPEAARRRAIDHLVGLWLGPHADRTETLDGWVVEGMAGAWLMSHVVGDDADLDALARAISNDHITVWGALAVEQVTRAVDEARVIAADPSPAYAGLTEDQVRATLMEEIARAPWPVVVQLTHWMATRFRLPFGFPVKAAPSDAQPPGPGLSAAPTEKLDADEDLVALRARWAARLPREGVPVHVVECRGYVAGVGPTAELAWARAIDHLVAEQATDDDSGGTVEEWVADNLDHARVWSASIRLDGSQGGCEWVDDEDLLAAAREGLNPTSGTSKAGPAADRLAADPEIGADDLARWMDLPVRVPRTEGGVPIYVVRVVGSTLGAGATPEAAKRAAIEHLVGLWNLDGAETGADTVDEYVIDGMEGAEMLTFRVVDEGDVEAAIDAVSGDGVTNWSRRAREQVRAAVEAARASLGV